MATTKTEKPALHGAAAASHSKAEAAKGQGKSSNPKADEAGSASKAGNKSDAGKKSR